MPDTPITIPAEERGLAVITHLSGLAGYIIPGAGVIVPIVIWMVKKDVPIIAAIAKQALILNLAAFAAICVLVLLFLTIILIPLVFAAGLVIGIAVIALPIMGAIKASSGVYYKYPVIGATP
jgi:uncharacterized Tic20 family protein